MNKNLYLFTILITLLASCGGHKGERAPSSIQFNQAIVAGGEPLTAEEMSIALRICYAFRSKNTNFKTQMLGKPFRFILSERLCNGQSRTGNIETVLHADPSDSNRLFFDGGATTIPHNTEVFTHLHGPSVELCSLVLRGETPLNSLDGATSSSKISFYVENGRDHFNVSYGKRNSQFDPTYKVYKIQRFEVMTDATASGDYLGLVSSIEEQELCTDNKTTSRRTQDFTESF